MHAFDDQTSRVLFDTVIEVKDSSWEDGLPPGEDIACAIREITISRGFTASELDATSWSYAFTLSVAEGLLSIDVADNSQWAPKSWPRWSVLIDAAPRSFFARFRREAPKALQDAFVRFRMALHGGLTSDQRFSNVGWLRAAEWRPDSTATPRLSP
jgi:hypothetical protein